MSMTKPVNPHLRLISRVCVEGKENRLNRLSRVHLKPNSMGLSGNECWRGQRMYPVIDAAIPVDCWETPTDPG